MTRSEHHSKGWMPGIALQSPFGRVLLRARLEFERLIWIGVTRSPAVAKRTLDIVLSAIALVMLAPLFLLIALCIKIEDRGPIFFNQTRVGKYGRHFKMFKF